MVFDLCSKANLFFFRGKLIFIKSGGKWENFAHKFFEYAPFWEFDDRNCYDQCIVAFLLLAVNFIIRHRSIHSCGCNSTFY